MSIEVTEIEQEKVFKRIESLGFEPQALSGYGRTVIACLGDGPNQSALQGLEAMPGVSKVLSVLAPYKLAAREIKPGKTVVRISDSFVFGGDNIPVIAGPCAIESEEQIVSLARSCHAAGANALRGGAFKPRSSTYSFQGLGLEGLKLLALAREETGLPIVTEVLDEGQLEEVYEYADMLQVGARSMQNVTLLRALGKVRKPVLLKRGMMATIDELLMSAEYILVGGNDDVVLCERGIRTFETATRNTLDLSAVPALQDRTHLPVIVDPSHGTGVARYVPAMSKAAVACGADGLIIEVHPHPEAALSDGVQSLTPEVFSKLMVDLQMLAGVLGRTLGRKSTVEMRLKAVGA